MKYAVAALAALLFAACPGSRREDFSQGGPAKTSTTTAPATPSSPLNPVTPPQVERPSTRVPAGANQTVDVQLTEYAIRMPESLTAGHYTLNIVNAGKIDHGFVIEGAGVHAALAEPLKRGNTGTIGVQLMPGTYQIYCNVDEHKGKGMSFSLVVR